MRDITRNLLDTYSAILLSTSLSHDEQIGYLTALSIYSPNFPGLLDGPDPLRGRAVEIRNAVSEWHAARFNNQRKQIAAAAVVNHAAIRERINVERETIAAISVNLHEPQALENLQLHITRLTELEKKAGKA